MYLCAAAVTGCPVTADCSSSFALAGFDATRLLFTEAAVEGSAAGSLLTLASLAAVFARGLGMVLEDIAALVLPAAAVSCPR